MIIIEKIEWASRPPHCYVKTKKDRIYGSFDFLGRSPPMDDHRQTLLKKACN
jgi:hypothetical protein